MSYCKINKHMPRKGLYLFIQNSNWNLSKMGYACITSHSILTVAQSICTHYSCFENMGWFVTLKKSDPKYGSKERKVTKKKVHRYSEREKAWLPLLFLNNDEPFFSGPIAFNSLPHCSTLLKLVPRKVL